MNSKTLIRKALSLCLTVAIVATYSMVAFAGTEKIAGELLIAGNNSSVTVNGETARNGRSIFSASTVSTPEGTSAIINLGKVGKLELAPNTTVNVSFTENGISGDLAAGTITVLDAANSVNITTPEGKTLKLEAGQSAAAAGAGKDKDDDDSKVGGLPILVWVAIAGGAIAAVAIAATTDNNRVALGGGTTVVSTNR